MCSKVLDHEIGINLVFEPILALHGGHQAVRHAVRQDELNILVLIVVLEVVIMLVSGDEAALALRPDVEKDREVELLVMNHWIRRHSPIDIEIAFLAELIDRHGELVDLIIQSLLGETVYVLVNDARSEHVIGRLNDVLREVEELAVDELAEHVGVVEARMLNVDL